jgi:hypothetical protein
VSASVSPPAPVTPLRTSSMIGTPAMSPTLPLSGSPHLYFDIANLLSVPSPDISTPASQPNSHRPLAFLGSPPQWQASVNYNGDVYSMQSSIDTPISMKQAENTPAMPPRPHKRYKLGEDNSDAL